MKLALILLVCSLSAQAQIIFQIGDKKASIVSNVTYDTAVCLSLYQMDNIMIELLKCDSIAATSIISDLQLTKYKSLVNTYEAQINDLNAAQNTSDDYAHMFYAINPISGYLLLEKGLYDFELSHTGYSYSNSSYLGWITQHERLQNLMGYEPTNDTENSFAFRIKLDEEGIL
jgi:hypothetical protein